MSHTGSNLGDNEANNEVNPFVQNDEAAPLFYDNPEQLIRDRNRAAREAARRNPRSGMELALGNPLGSNHSHHISESQGNNPTTRSSMKMTSFVSQQWENSRHPTSGTSHGA
ncbi:unnamed protein product [Rhodiola kirilowii]